MGLKTNKFFEYVRYIVDFGTLEALKIRNKKSRAVLKKTKLMMAAQRRNVGLKI